MRERGTVTAAGDGRVDLAIVPCATCATCGACGEAEDGLRMLSGVIDTTGARPGDIVEVETSAAARHRAQWFVYILPVACLVGGYLAGFLLSDLLGVTPDIGGAILGLVAGAAAVAATRFVGRNVAGVDRYEPRVHAIISRGQERRHVVD